MIHTYRFSFLATSFSRICIRFRCYTLIMIPYVKSSCQMLIGDSFYFDDLKYRIYTSQIPKRKISHVQFNQCVEHTTKNCGCTNDNKRNFKFGKAFATHAPKKFI